MATVLDQDEIDDYSTYVITRLRRGEHKYLLLVSLLAGIFCALKVSQMPRPFSFGTLSEMLAWGLIGLLAALSVFMAGMALLHFNIEWTIEATGIRLKRSSLLGVRIKHWSAEAFKNLRVQVTPRPGSLFYYITGFQRPTYYILQHLVSGRSLLLEMSVSRDQTARVLKQIRKRLPDVQCEDFRPDSH